ncbi:MAG: hypothetical protein GXP62_17860 [Oligoflexia bacterium]|nr:hypothetical protein [Oligoflexia bacterium]
MNHTISLHRAASTRLPLALSLALGLGLGLSLSACDVLGGNGTGGTGTGSGTGTDSGTGEPGMLSRDNYQATSDANGYLEIPVEVGADTSAFMVTIESEKYPTLESLTDPSGNEVLYWKDWYSSTESLTSAFFLQGNTMAFNWPVREVDGPLEPGTWTVKASTISRMGSYSGNTDVEVTVMTKADPDLTTSQVHVQIVWAQDVDQDADVVAAVEAAVERWREIWGNYGVELVESYSTSDLDPSLPFASTGSSEVQTNAERFDGQTLVLIVGETIGNDNSLFGIAGGIPGSIEPNNYTYVTLSWLAHAGSNGNFSDNEIRLMGETAAHECGHFLGLFHPVESSYNYWDALDDTSQCSTWQACENRLGSNLMFPYPICGFTSCDPQGDLTPQQEGVWQRYIGAL